MRNSKEIIDYLNEVRKQQNISITELSRRVGMAKSGVSRYFNHTREFPINRVPEFAKALHVKPEDVLGVEKFNKDNVKPKNIAEEKMLVAFRKQTAGMSEDDQIKFQRSLNKLMDAAKDLNSLGD